MYIRDNDCRKIMICLIAIIALFILISNTYFNAKYRSRFTGSDSVKIAKWNNDIDTTSNPDILYAVSENVKDTNSYTITVNSTSEVSSKYAIILSNVPNNLQVKLDRGVYRSTTDGTITFGNAGTFLVGEETSRTHTLTFNDLLNSNNFGDITIGIDVIIEQID